MNIKFPKEYQNQWGLEGQLYSSICTLDLLIRNLDSGEMDPSSYHKQHTELINIITKNREILEKQNFDFSAFLTEENILINFPRALEQLSSSENYKEMRKRLDYHHIKGLPHIAAEFVANAIELLDLLHLEAIATVERILPYLDELYANLKQIPFYTEDHWIRKDISGWINLLDYKKAGDLIDGADLKKLNLQVSRWLADVRRELKFI